MGMAKWAEAIQDRVELPSVSANLTSLGLCPRGSMAHGVGGGVCVCVVCVCVCT